MVIQDDAPKTVVGREPGKGGSLEATKSDSTPSGVFFLTGDFLYSEIFSGDIC
jgi:hypothetical protein